MIDDVVVISLRDRNDRAKDFIRGLPSDWRFPYPRFVDGIKITLPPPNWQGTLGAFGCLRAHLNVLDRIGPGATLVLEDDAVFAPAFMKKWNRLEPAIPADWQMLMLGGQHLEEPIVSFGSPWVRCRSTIRTHAYVVNRPDVPTLMESILNQKTSFDFGFPDYQNIAAVYAPEEFIVGQRAGRSDVTGIVSPRDEFWIR